MAPIARLCAVAALAAASLVMPPATADEWFPAGALFPPPIADPKVPRFFVSALQYEAETLDAEVSAFGFGETFGIHRRTSATDGAWQVGISGGLIGLLQLDEPDRPLLNTDYLIGLPLDWRNGAHSLRVRLYHQSSHLGDDLLRRHPDRFIDFQYEAIELLAGRDLGGLRLYAGGEYLLRRHPSGLAQELLHAGLDYRRPHAFGSVGFIAGLDLKHWRENPEPAVALTAGLTFGGIEPGDHYVALVLDAYQGYSPYGSFFVEDVTYWGAALRVGF